MKKIGLPKHFIHIIKTLYTNARSRILVNGHLTRPIELKKGVRQGDHLSLYLFLIAINPLAVKIQNDITIQGIKLPGRHSVKCPSYADDITLTLIGKASLRAAFRVLENLKQYQA